MTAARVLTPGAHMRAEIAEQPDRWRDLITSQHEAIEAAAELIRGTDPELLVFAARGSSDHAAQYGQYLAHNLLGIPAMLATPSTVTAFGTTLRFPRSVILAVSQSGESPDLLATVRATGESGVPIVAFTNSAASSLAQLGDVHVGLAAGSELSVAATKTYTAELLALYTTISRASGVAWSDIIDAVDVAASAAADLIGGSAPIVAAWTDALLDADRVLIVGRGYSMSTAKEGALKLMETNSIAASGWSAADAKHGPLGQVIDGTPVIFLTASPGGRESVEAFKTDVGGLGGRALAIDETFPGLAWPNLDPALIPLLEIIPLQQLALELALARGMDPDRPPGLLKITQTH
ncbi:SIS domain-containing protein [Cryobacterium sp. N19]|uniref:SIS domain-containing protein n=1 Tax=Cryobacterium sp. N19 TaxID=2048288 RepID=UPI000CE426F8|nr:SIS domain-containing protein [Cryobacterium sp. N19]